MSVGTDPLLGTDLAGYRIESVLGRGGMGVVYLATDLRLERKVALKIIAPELAADPRFRERFLHEARLAASLDHSHVVPVYGAGEMDARLWLAMRYVEGTDLASLLRKESPLEPPRAVELVSQIAEALDAAHAHGLVHRDVKPANVLVTREGEGEHCYLADFGLARSAGEDSLAAAHLSGTIDYTAPEQIAGAAVDQRADVYGLACVLYECLVGEPPFRSERSASTLFAHLEQAPPSLRARQPELPEAADAVVARGLAKDPAERYESAGELSSAIRTACGLDRESRLSRRALLLSAGGALLVASAVAVPVSLLTRGGGASTSAPILPLAGDSVVRIDPVSTTLAQAVTVASADGALAYGEGALWLADRDRAVVSKIDPGTGTVTDEIPIPETSKANLLAAGEGSLWLSYDVSNHLGDVWQYALAGGGYRLVETNDITVDGFEVAAGSLWTVCETFLRIDPASGSIEAALEPDGGHGLFISATEDTVWFAGSRGDVIASGGSGRIWRGDPRTNTLVGTIDIGVVIAGIAADSGGLWVLGLEDDLVRHVDSGSHEVADAFRVGRIPTALAVGSGEVWVTSSRDGTVTHFDPATSDIKTIEVGGAAQRIVVGGGSVWTTVTV